MRAALFESARSEAWWGAVDRAADEGDTGEVKVEKAVIRGATARASTNLRLYWEYLGLRFIKNDWVDMRGVFAGCMAEAEVVPDDDVDAAEEERLGGTGEVGGDVDADVALAECSAGVSDATWRAVRGAVDESTTKPRKTMQKERNERYLRARRNLADANKRWKASCQDYKDARRGVKHARHEVHKTRKAVRVEFR